MDEFKLLQTYKFVSVRGVKAVALPVLAGFLVRAIQDNLDSQSCQELFVAPKNSAPALSLIRHIDKGNLVYPKPLLIGFLMLLDNILIKVLPLVFQVPFIRKTLIKIISDHMQKNSIFLCKENSDDHKKALCDLI